MQLIIKFNKVTFPPPCLKNKLVMITIVMTLMCSVCEVDSRVVKRDGGGGRESDGDQGSGRNSNNYSGSLNIKEIDAELDAFIRKLGLMDYEVLGGEGLWEPRFMDHMGHQNAIHYTNEWLVHIPNSTNKNEESDPDAIAKNSGYRNDGQVKGFPDIYRFVKIDHPEAHHRGARELTEQLQDHHQVNWADQQYAKLRMKRSFDIMGMLGLNNLSINLNPLNLQLPSFLQAGPQTPPPGPFHEIVTRYNDPLWEKEWYMLDTRTKKSLTPKLDLNVIPVFKMGITGKGSSVCVLDDGLEHTHTDLIDNYDPRISGDLNSDDRDPMPVYNKKPPNSHGTRCAGEISMKANNSVCGVGIAYDTRIGGVRMLDGPVSDRIEGEALIYALPGVDIYSASWGPSDDGETVEGPGRLAQAAFIRGTQQGRDGKGVIYVWASGNGGAKGDSCSCDGYASSIYTLSVGSATEKGAFPWYGEPCASTMAVTYSSGAYTDQKVATTDIQNTCTTGHTGTSASAPLAAGIVALTLQANRRLTWRDVQHLVAWTSEPAPVADNPGWFTNGVGFRVSPRFGFGLMDAHAMVSNALEWKNVPKQKICRVQLGPLTDGRLTGPGVKRAVFVTDGCRGTANEINFLEHVECVTDVQYNERGALQIDLTSPQGTTTRLLFPRKNDASAVGFTDWPFMSVHTWGEHPAGSWIVTFSDAKRDPDNRGQINRLELVLYGTTEEPEYRKSGARVYPQYSAEASRSLTRREMSNDHKNEKLANLQAILNDIHAEELVGE